MLVTSLAKDQGNVKIVGLAIANGLVALAGSAFCQEERVFEISMGTGGDRDRIMRVLLSEQVSLKSLLL